MRYICLLIPCGLVGFGVCYLMLELVTSSLVDIYYLGLWCVCTFGVGLLFGLGFGLVWVVCFLVLI